MAEDPTDPDSLSPQDADTQSHSEELPLDDAKDAQINRMAGCARLGGCLLKVALLTCLISGLVTWAGRCLMISQGKGQIYLKINATMKDMQVAVGHFRTEYNCWPFLQPMNEKDDTALRSRGQWLAALLGEEKTLNLREIKFLDLPQARDAKNGVLREDDELVLMDRWGEPFYVVFDTNNDNQIADPENPLEHLSTTVVIYSSGPDRDPKTWEDNVRSWK